MKIAVFESSKYERPYVTEYAKEYQLELVTTEQVLTAESIALATGCQGISILGHSRMDEELLNRMKDMGIFCLTTRTIGYDHIDIEAATRQGVQVCHSAYAPNGVAEFTIMLMLMVLRQYKPAMWRQQVNDYSIEGLMGKELGQQTIGVIGTGRVGTAIVKMLKGFGSNILTYDVHENPEIQEDVTYVDIETLYKNSDIITLHLPLMADTRNMIDQKAINMMKDSVVLINTARGELIDTQALIEGIEQCKIGGLGLDVLAGEQGIYHYNRKTEILTNKEMSYLRQFPNVILTQHVAFFTDRDIKDMVFYGIKGLADMLRGKKCIENQIG